MKYYCFSCQDEIKEEEICICIGREITIFTNFLRFHERCFEESGMTWSAFDRKPGIMSFGMPYIIICRNAPDGDNISRNCLDYRYSYRMHVEKFIDIAGKEIYSYIPIDK